VLVTVVLAVRGSIVSLGLKCFFFFSGAVWVAVCRMAALVNEFGIGLFAVFRRGDIRDWGCEYV
jgi:hypothetical protein